MGGPIIGLGDSFPGPYEFTAMGWLGRTEVQQAPAPLDRTCSATARVTSNVTDSPLRHEISLGYSVATVVATVDAGAGNRKCRTSDWGPRSKA